MHTTDNTTNVIDEPADWHRTPCEVTDWLVVSGDLPPNRADAEALLERWIALGITDIIDVREEWNDAELVAELAPDLRYHHLGTHDDGGWQEDHWFDAGLAAIREVRARGGRAIVHCHMGVNRAPSMAFRMLLDAGHAPTEALAMLRTARPIARILYAEAAVSHHLRAQGVDHDDAVAVRREVNQWLLDNRVDTLWIISRIRRAES